MAKAKQHQVTTWGFVARYCEETVKRYVAIDSTHQNLIVAEFDKTERDQPNIDNSVANKIALSIALYLALQEGAVNPTIEEFSWTKFSDITPKAKVPENGYTTAMAAIKVKSANSNRIYSYDVMLVGVKNIADNYKNIVWKSAEVGIAKPRKFEICDELLKLKIKAA